MKLFQVGLAVLLVCGIIGCSSSEKQSSDDAAQPANTSKIGSAQTKSEGAFTSYGQAVARAKTSHKLILADVYTDWCVWCKRMDKDVYPDARVQTELGKYFTAAKLNAESSTMQNFMGAEHSEQQIASSWKVEAYPTIVLLSPDEQIIEKIPGYVPPEEFAKVLRYFGSGAYKENPNYEDWKKTQT